MTRIEWGLKNYLNKHDIYKDNEEMQTIIINSFFVEAGGDNNTKWISKVIFTQNHFGLFCQYAQNNWKTVEKT